MATLAHYVLALIIALAGFIMRNHTKSLEDRITALEALLDEFTRALEATGNSSEAASKMLDKQDPYRRLP